MSVISNDTVLSGRGSPSAGGNAFVDPLDDDVPGDDVVVTTRRGITRVALVAAEAAGRFQREGVAHDPMSWMLAPRRLFAGASAIEACLERDACMRAVLIHGLSLGLDADPDEIDALAALDGDEGSDADRALVRDDERILSPRAAGPGAGAPERLFTATVASHDGFEVLHAFHASLAREESEVAGRLYMRLGAAAADAVIEDGFDPEAPMVESLVAPAMRRMLAHVADDPASPLAHGLDVNIEQRFYE